MLLSGGKDSLLRYIKSGDRIIDLGGGKGDRWIPILEKFPNLHLTFCEPDENELKIANSRVRGRNVVFLTGTELVKTASQDKVYSFAVLEHVWDQQNFFSEISRILANNGVGYISYDDGHFRNYLYRDRDYTFRFRNFLKTKLFRFWKLLKIYRKYQHPVNANELFEVVSKNGLVITDEYYSNLDNFKNFRMRNTSKLFREVSDSVYFLEEQLNIEYRKNFALTQRVRNHGPIWKVMGTRTIKIKHAKK